MMVWSTSLTNPHSLRAKGDPMSRLNPFFAAVSSCLLLASAATAAPPLRAARAGLDPSDASGDAGAAAAPLDAAPLAAPALPPADTGHFIVPFANPGYADTTPLDINDQGVIVGHFRLSADFSAPDFAFLFQGSVFSDVSPAGAAGFSELNGINEQGDSVGDFIDAAGADRGFLRSAGGAVTVLPDPLPGVANNFPSGINSRGVIVGSYTNDPAFRVCTGWIFRGGSYTTIDIPGAVCVFANGINDRGDIVGTWVDARRFGHAFLLTRDDEEADQRLVAIDVPGANFTSPLRISERGQIAGSYVVGTVPRHRKLHGFIRRGERVLTLDNPAARLTAWSGITENGILVGNQITFGGFLALPLPR